MLRESYGGHAHDERMIGSLNSMMQRACDVLTTATKLFKV